MKKEGLDTKEPTGDLTIQLIFSRQGGNESTSPTVKKYLPLLRSI